VSNKTWKEIPIGGLIIEPGNSVNYKNADGGFLNRYMIRQNALIALSAGYIVLIRQLL